MKKYGPMVVISNSHQAGGCNYCEEPRYPDRRIVLKVTPRNGNGVEVRLCLDCAKDLRKQLNVKR